MISLPLKGSEAADNSFLARQIVAVLPVTDGRSYRLVVFQDTNAALDVKGSQSATWFAAYRI